MAVTKGAFADALAANLVTDIDADSTAEADVTTGAGLLYYVYIDNSQVTSATYVKLADNTSATSSSTVPDFIFYAPAQTTLSYIAQIGHDFEQGVSFWATSTQANAATQTDPSADVAVRILAT